MVCMLFYEACVPREGVVVVGVFKKKKSIYLSVLFGQSYSLKWIKAFTKLFVEKGDDA